MDINPLIMAGTVTGSTIFAAYSAYKSFSHSRELIVPYLGEESRTDKTGSITALKGLTKISNILSVLPNGIIRTRSGGYICGFRFKPSESFYGTSDDTRRLYDRLAMMLTSNLPKNAVVQIRFDNSTDSGEMLNQHLLELAQNADSCDATAQVLKTEELDYYFDLAEAGSFRTGSFEVWVNIPADRTNSQTKNGFEGIMDAVGRFDLKGVKDSLFSNDKKIVCRYLEDEEKAYENAVRHFKTVEQNFPLHIKAFNFDETCVKLRLSHNPTIKSIPTPPSQIDTDWQGYISRTTIKSFGGWYLWHGSMPVTVVTLFEPPESSQSNPTCYPGLMRFLTVNPTLRGKISVVSEFVISDKDENIAKLKKELKKMRETNTRPGNRVEFKDEKVKRSYYEKQQMLTELTSPGKSLTELRFHIIVRGDEVRLQEEKKETLKNLEERANEVIRLIHENMMGAQADFEDPVALRDIYEKTLIGELTHEVNFREIREQALSLSCFIPAESDWRGITKDPHNIFVNTAGELTGVNLLRNPYSATPLTLILGAAGSGKSVLAAELISGFLSKVPNSRVRACDYGGSLAPLVNLFNGRYFRFSDKDQRTINVWDYEGLETQTPPDDEQIELVVKDTLILLGIDDRSENGRDFAAVLEKCVRQVYADEVPRNQPGRRHEPRLSHLLRKLATHPFESTEDRVTAGRMKSRLDNFQNNAWVDAPTDESFRHESRFDVYELSSLDKLPETLRACLAFRIGARVGSGDEDINGINPATLVVFDEVHELVSNEYLRFTLRGAEKTVRHGRKKNKVPILITHSFDDIKAFPGFISNIGNIFVGKQDDITSLREWRKWNPVVESTIYGIENQKGLASQFLYATGQGDKQKMTVIQVYLSPISLWTFTTDPPEDEARKLVSNALPHWSWSQVLVFLARTYPRGLSYENKTKIDESVLREIIAAEQQINPQYRQYVKNAEKMGEDLTVLPATLDFEEFADEAMEMIEEEIQMIQRNNFLDTTLPELAAIDIQIPGLKVIDVQGE